MAAWITFDCFGTLIDWQSGFARVLTPVAHDKTPELLLAYHRMERLLEREKPHRPYRDVLASSLFQAARETGLILSAHECRQLPAKWGTLPVFEDVEPMLDDLRQAGYQLGVLTNCDDDLFRETERSFKAPFDAVVTAERVGDYKPSPSHFRYFARTMKPERWIHVACSWYHDIAPARELGVTRVWLDRDCTGEDPATASARVLSAGEVAAAISRFA